MTVVEQLFEEIRKWTRTDDALRMQLEADVQIWLKKEQEQLNKACQGEQFFCTCSRAKGLDHDEEGTPYCISCQKEVQ